MNLSDTVNLMCSNDWEDRFIAEYVQLQIRIIRLEEALNNTSDSFSVLDSRTRALMMKQRDAMESYRNCLVRRAEIANIDLFSYPAKEHH